jgi:cation:H+ antiporter
VRPQAVPTAVLAIDLPVLLLATLALFPILWTGGSISRREGLVLLVGYAIYLTALAWRGP